MQRFIYLTLVLIGFNTTLFSQVLKGTISDVRGKPLPFSTVYIKEITYGTAANEDGKFELKVQEGNYTCEFQSLGFQTVSKKVTIGKKDQPLHVVLPDMVYALNEVVIASDGEDPAYKIMRNVIRKAPEYASLVKSYNANVYIRGSVEIEKIGKMIKWMARKELKESKIKEGETYFEESVNEINFKSPNIIHQKVKSIHSTFPIDKKNSSAGAMGFITQNTYHPRSFGNAISPITAGAFSYYKYQYEGTNKYGNVMVNKIKVIPKGDGPQYVHGYLYIIDDLWCIYSMNLTINSQLGITIKINQAFSEIRDAVWLPINNTYTILISIMSSKSDFNYHSSIKYNSLEINKFAAVNIKSSGISAKKKTPENKTQLRVNRIDKKLQKLAELDNPKTAEAYRTSKLINRKKDIIRKDTLKNDHTFIETYKTEFDSTARLRDTTYWNQIRPIPLSEVESVSARSFDSIHFEARITKNDTTLSNPIVKKKYFKTLLLGGRVDLDSLNSLSSKGLFYPFGLSFNAVDGFVYKTNVEYTNTIKNKGLLTLDFSPGYAFSRKAMVWPTIITFNLKLL